MPPAAYAACTRSRWQTVSFLPGPVLLVSPHMDDAALSCEGLLGRSEPLDVLTVFAGEPAPPRQGDWDALCGFPDSSASTAARRAEEREALAGTPHRLHLLPLLESQHLDGPRPSSDAAPIRAAVLEWHERHGPGSIVVPACAGRSHALLEGALGRPTSAHRDRIKRSVGPLGRRILARLHRSMVVRDVPIVHGDHRFVRDAVLEALDGVEPVTRALYEEVPYLWGAAADREVARVAAGRRLQADPVVLTVDRAAKARRVGAYRSQVAAPLRPVRAAGHAGRPPGDRALLAPVALRDVLERSPLPH